MNESISLFSKVKTSDGVGTVVSLSCQKVNGLYYVPECAEVTVWYGMDNVSNGWVTRTYDLKDVSII